VVPTRAQRGQEIAASPLKLFETMACGLPVVASDLPAIRDVVRDGENGLLFAQGDAGALAAALRRLRDDPGLRARLGERGRRDVQRYAWPERARRILAFFEHIERGAAAARGVSAAS
jgi:glycosyltransferase involved in cell wall biosynthesis